MKRIEVEVFSETVNCPVLRMPQRRFPGVLVQGDSLAILQGLADEILELSACGDKEELALAVRMLKDKVAGYLDSYERTMSQSGLELPYSKAK
jgi:hypothetical protein